jgi:hypothetical protein
MSTAIAAASAPDSIESWTADLLRRGYVPGAPTEAVAEIDRQCVASAECVLCGHHGLSFNPFVLEARDGHRARYVVLGGCPACGQAAEF